jgi:hypothetical protein
MFVCVYSGLPGDRFYEFRVDVHYSDDNKVVDTASPGFPSQPATFIYCTSRAHFFY